MTDDPIRRMLEEAWNAGAVYGCEKATDGEQPSAETRRTSDIDAVIAQHLSSSTISVDLSHLTGTGIDVDSPADDG